MAPMAFPTRHRHFSPHEHEQADLDVRHCLPRCQDGADAPRRVWSMACSRASMSSGRASTLPRRSLSRCAALLAGRSGRRSSLRTDRAGGRSARHSRPDLAFERRADVTGWEAALALTKRDGRSAPGTAPPGSKPHDGFPASRWCASGPRSPSRRRACRRAMVGRPGRLLHHREREAEAGADRDARSCDDRSGREEPAYVGVVVC
jgi:hypothetical protein